MGPEEAIVSSLVHTPTGYKITFDMRGKHISVTFSPGRQSPQDHEFCLGWVEMHYNAKDWTVYLKRELDAPNLWAVIERQRQLAKSAVAVGTPNTRFNEDEQQFISARLDEIKAQLTAMHQLQEDHGRLLSDQFEFLKEESKTQPRKNWMLMVLGTVASFGLSQVKPEAVKDLLGKVIDAFAPLVTKLLESGTGQTDGLGFRVGVPSGVPITGRFVRFVQPDERALQSLLRPRTQAGAPSAKNISAPSRR